MDAGKLRSQGGSSLRRRILAFVGGLVILSLLGSTISVFRISQVTRLLDAINRVSVPMGRLLAQMQSDAEVFRRELERGLGYTHWKDPHWRPRPIPRWIEDVMEGETDRVKVLVKNNSPWVTDEARARWIEWANSISDKLLELRREAARLYTALEQRDEAAAAEIYPRWISSIEEWRRQVQWGATEYDRVLRQTFALAESRTSELRTGLEIVLAVVVMLSLLLLWLGDRALRPLADLTTLAREITRRGLRKEDKALLPEIPITRDDEVSQLAREFHHMATALLEREKMVESQKSRLQEQNRLLREMGALNENVLHSIESVLIVTDTAGFITQCNPVAKKWLAGESDAPVIGSLVSSWKQLMAFPEIAKLRLGKIDPKIEPMALEGRIYGGEILALRQEDGSSRGTILVLDDLTEELNLQERLTRAENLAAVGRMSAQVAHEVRNPLHSIGLEAEIAAEMAAETGNIPLKQSLQSILGSVDRLEKITDNYLKLSRLSTGERKIADVGEVIESVLATYAPVCESQGVLVDWVRQSQASLRVWADPDLLEQVFGNLFRNALQALEGEPAGAEKRIHWAMGNAESGRVWIRIEDNGHGISPDVRVKLFTPFVTTRAEGTGLGLSFVKKVIEDHGGEVNSPERPSSDFGQGACFEILLPPAPAATDGPETVKDLNG